MSCSCVFIRDPDDSDEEKLRDIILAHALGARQQHLDLDPRIH